MIYVKFVLTPFWTIKGTMHSNENNKIKMRNHNYSVTVNRVGGPRP
jgi:hypothetical protein